MFLSGIKAMGYQMINLDAHSASRPEPTGQSSKDDRINVQLHVHVSDLFIGYSTKAWALMIP